MSVDECRHRWTIDTSDAGWSSVWCLKYDENGNPIQCGFLAVTYDAPDEVKAKADLVLPQYWDVNDLPVVGRGTK